MTMTIDVHAHVLPSSAQDAARTEGRWFGAELRLGPAGNPMRTDGGVRALGTAAYMLPTDHRLVWMDEAGIDVQVVSLVPPMFGYDMAAPDAHAMTQETNDEISDLTRQHPGRFLGLATLPLGDPAAAVDELQRAMALPGIVGIEVGTNVNGLNWDDDGLFAVLEAAEDADAFVFIHPNDVRARPFLGMYYLGNGIGNPLETTIAASTLIFGGVLDRLPTLAVCLAHGGGYLPVAAGRLDHIGRVRPESKDLIEAVPTEYLRRFYYDALLHRDLSVKHLVDTVGADRVVVGTDHPADMGLVDPVNDLKNNALLTADQVAAITEGNLAPRLLS